MLRTDKTFQCRTVAWIEEKRLCVEEKSIEIPIVDNKEYRMDLISRIEAISLGIIKQISIGKLPCLSFRNKRIDANKPNLRQKAVVDAECSISSEESASFFVAEKNCRENFKETTVNFSSKRSRDKFVLMVTMMAEIHRLLLTNSSRTRRSFYYDLKNQGVEDLVPDQKYVDRVLIDVANLIDCTPWDLRLLATAKGLVAGKMTIVLADSQAIDCTISGGALIPHLISDITSIRVKANFVLVVEKDTVFQKLLEENCPRFLGCILITAKGYPDVATRMLVKLLSVKMGLPVYIIVDADPFGLDIMLIYRFGSRTLCKGNDSLACPNARWLGILPSELMVLGTKTTPLTEADLVKLKSIEARPYVNEAISKQLHILRKGKAEIEAVSFLSKNFLTATYLPYKIDGQDYI